MIKQKKSFALYHMMITRNNAMILNGKSYRLSLKSVGN